MLVVVLRCLLLIRCFSAGAMTISEATGFLKSYWRDLVNVAGVVITTVALVVTIFTFRRAKAAAEAAKEAVKEARKRTTWGDSVADFAAVLQIIEELKRLHREKAWIISLDRYSVIRRHLVSLQTSALGITGEQRSMIGSAIEQFRIMEQTVEQARGKNREATLNVARLNDIAAALSDDLNRVMISMRQKID